MRFLRVRLLLNIISACGASLGVTVLTTSPVQGTYDRLNDMLNRESLVSWQWHSCFGLSACYTTRDCVVATLLCLLAATLANS